MHNFSSNNEDTNTWQKAEGMKDEPDSTRLLGSQKIQDKIATFHKLLNLKELCICPFKIIWLSFFEVYEHSGHIVWESHDLYLFDSGHFIVCWKNKLTKNMNTFPYGNLYGQI